MKKIMNLIGILLLLCLISCSKSDEVNIALPEVSYGEEIKAAFFTKGSSNAPKVTWNADIGKFGLESAVSGISIEKSTGVISWNKSLTLGNHPITVLVYNNVGTTTLDIDLENRFQGKFEGVRSFFGEDIQVQLTYNPDGTCVLLYDNSDPIEGTWNFEDHKIMSRNENEEYIYIVKGSITHNPTKVAVKGSFSSFAQGATKGIGSTFHMDMIIED